MKPSTTRLSALAILVVAACSSDGRGPKGPGTPPPASLKQLRTFEYVNTIHDLFGGRVSLTTELRSDRVRANFTSVSAAIDCYEDVGLEARESAAIEAAEQAFQNSPTPLEETGCAPQTPSDPCIADFVRSFGERAWRRPLTESEVTKYANLTAELANHFGGDPVKGSELTVAAMLQSPYFLYRVELGEPIRKKSQTRKYSPYEMATRLSYTLWETTPDAALLEAAANGELQTERSVREHATRMLQDPRANAALTRFWREHLNVDRVTLANYPKPGATEELYAAMREEGRWLIDQVTTPGADARLFLTSKNTYVNSELAAHYGMTFAGEGFHEVDLPAERQGFLTSGVFLTTMSHPSKTSPTRRGKFVIERVLCRTIPPPPPGVELTLPDVPSGQATRRQLLEAHLESPVCQGCHAQTDPIGFAFEGFDALGATRDEDNGLPIDTTGTFEHQIYSNARDLLAMLTSSAEVAPCVSQQALRYATGHIETRDQRPYVDQLTEGLVASGHEYRRLIAEVVSSEAFRFANGFVGEAELNAEGEY